MCLSALYKKKMDIISISIIIGLNISYTGKAIALCRPQIHVKVPQ